MTDLLRRVGASERGAEAVEFALVVPVFMLLVFGVIDFGYMINRDTLINNASREGAREGSLNIGATADNDIKCRVRRALATIETPGGGASCLPGGTPKVTVSVACRVPVTNAACGGTFPAGAATGGTVIVTISYTHRFITPLGSSLRPLGLALSKTTEMRIE